MRLKLLILVLGLQTAWILGTCLTQERALFTGTVVLLETRPVDPRDLLRGDYVTLNYKISTLALDLLSPSNTNALPPGQTIYVALEPRGQFHEAVRASTKPIPPAPGQVVLKGRMRAWWSNPGASSVQVEYGLERYYVQEGTGNPPGKITVQAAVPTSGQARIKEVLVNGQPYAQAMKGATR